MSTIKNGGLPRPKKFLLIFGGVRAILFELKTGTFPAKFLMLLWIVVLGCLARMLWVGFFDAA